MQVVSSKENGAFVEEFSLPPTGEGQLSGLRFAVKDLIDVAGHRTGCGNPTWLATHPPAAVHAVCVEQLLAAGARCEGKTITDEVAFSLIGQNHFYGTPLNPAAPDRVPGGSSSGSASAVASGLVDFALGTDTGGSVRVPASNCGIWGWRPTHGLVSVAGVMPFSPSLDTVGVLARNSDVLHRAAAVLIGSSPTTNDTVAIPENVHVLTEAFALADNEVRQSLQSPLDRLQKMFGSRMRETSLGHLCDDAQATDLCTWLDTYRILQGTEALSSLDAWVAEAKPEFGPATQAGFAFIRGLDRNRLGDIVSRREGYYRALRRALGPRDLVCIPTAPTIAPLKGSISYDRKGDYYQRTLSFTAIAGVGRLPQVSMPLARVGSAPIGLSLIAAHGEDSFLLSLAQEIEQHVINAH
jgi:amidase